MVILLIPLLLVHISNNLALHSVLYLPTFTFNLIFVTKLTGSLHCHLIVTYYACEIQELTTSRMIGSTKVEHRLYVFKGSSSLPLSIPSVNSNVSANLDVWHYRLGHLICLITKCMFCINCIHLFLSLITILLVLFVLLQSKWSFLFLLAPLSLPIFLKLVHMDIWGLFFVTSIHSHKYFLTVVDDYSRHMDFLVKT